MSNGHKLEIIFYVPGMEFDGNSLSSKALGGSETAALCMARELAKIGHHVKIFNNIKKPGKFNEVDYYPISYFKAYAAYTQSDVVISERVPQIFTLQMKSKINILWNHDLAVKNQRNQFRGSLWNIDEVFGLSDFHINQMSETYAVPKSVFWKTRNGIDPWLIKKANAKPIKRHPKRLIYTARPERGMDILLNDIMPKLWEKDPDIELHLAGYSFTTQEMLPFYESMKQKAKDYAFAGRKVKWLGELTKVELYREYLAASLYVYPSAFEEISCITAMEAMGCGLPFVGFDVGALKETLGLEETIIGPGALLSGNARDKKNQQLFVDIVLNYLAPEGLATACKELSQNKMMGNLGIERAKSLSWASIAQEWTDHFYDLFKERTSNNNRTERQFYKNEDIAAILEMPEGNGKSINIEKEYPFINDPEGAKQHYIAQGKSFADKLNKHDKPLILSETIRHKVVKEIIGKVKPKMILDFAGGVGNEAIQFVNDFGCEVLTVNISPEEQEYGKEFAQKLCKHPEKIKWQKETKPGQTSGLLSSIGVGVIADSAFPTYDVVFAGEYLEHCLTPEKTIDELEKDCKEGGLMVFTVPFGPWGVVPKKYTEYRGHLWNYEQSDLRDLFGKKKKLSLKVVGGPMNVHNKESLGWHVISYTKTKGDQHKTGTIDMARKLAIQSPGQTLSVCMIIGGDQEGLLHRCLKSIHFVADEIIIADCGMSKTCKDILALPQYADKIKVIDGLDPNAHGFDMARNVSIANAQCDWILWIDSDEELLLPENVFKYLRHNFYNGYSIRQHHFSARPANAFKCDVPIRFFRNGLGIKFFGVVHEHPEIEMNKSIGESTIVSDIEIAHDGYLTEETRRIRFDRNIGLIQRDRAKYPDRTLGKFLWLRDEVHLARYEMERNQGRITPQVKTWFEDVIKTYRKEFLGNPGLMGDEGLNFYSEAVKTLGRGIEYDMSLLLNFRGKQMEGGIVTKHFFDNKDDFHTYIQAKLKTITEPIEGPYIQ